MLHLQPHWNILFRQKFFAAEKTWEFHKQYCVPVQPYVGLVIRDGELLLLVSEATWDVNLNVFRVDSPNCPLTPDDVERVIKQYQSYGWALHESSGVVWEK